MTDGERHVLLSDAALVETAAKAAEEIDWSAFPRRRSGSRASAPQRKRSRAASVVSKSAGGKTCVSAKSVVACSVAELMQVLRPRSNELYTMTMRELHGQDFVFGRIAHNVRQTSVHGGEAEHAVASSNQRVFVKPQPNVDVKVALFARRHVFSHHEHWCFIEGLHSLRVDNDNKGDEEESRGFAVTRTSLSPADVLVGRSAEPVSVFNDVRVTYVVLPASEETEGIGPRSVLLFFQAEFHASPARKNSVFSLTSTNRAKLWRDISERALIARLKDMATTTQVFSEVIRRRRLSAQVFINVKAFRPPNTRCVCCSRQLTIILRRHKKQCHLCGYFVCRHCSSHHQVIRGVSVRVCNGCLTRIDDAIYENLPADTLAPATIVPEVLVPSGKLERQLQDALSASNPKEKEAAKAVIRTVVGLETGGITHEKCSEPIPDESYIDALQRLSDHSDMTSIASFDLASPITRDYPLEFAEDAGVQDAPRWPTPPDDAERIEWYNQVKPNLDRITNLAELEFICKLASKELQCAMTAITVVSDDTQYILATDMEEFQNGSISRTHTICAHTILEKQRPLLLPHPEADVRFSRTEDIRLLGIRFYFGFPITSSDGVVIGTFCSVDFKSHSVTQSQYSFISRLARCASRIVQQELAHETADPLA